jgi:hypothetical protein
VFSKERHINTYSKCAKDIYRVFSYLEWIKVRDVESWLREGKIHIETNPYKMCELADEFAVDIFSLTQGKDRTEKDVFYWALATAIWVYGGMNNINPEAKRSYASDCDERPMGAMYGGRK